MCAGMAVMLGPPADPEPDGGVHWRGAVMTGLLIWRDYSRVYDPHS